ncbi:MAG: MFS transporter [Thermodesulfovibrionia bacterium]
MKTSAEKILALISWASFDFAETIFSANILSVFFPLWLVNVLGGRPFHYSITYSTSLFVSILLAIFVGRYADMHARRKPLFLLAVIISGLCLLMLSRTDTLIIALIIFFFVNLFYQQSLVLYNSLLLSVSNRGDRAVSSGIGVSIGYIGGAAGLYAISRISPSETSAFMMVAILFVLFSVPTGIFVKERTVVAVNGVSLKRVIKDKGFMLFVISCLFLTEAAHTIIIFMSVYLDKVYGLNRQDIVPIIATAAVIAAIASPFIGRLSDGLGVRRVFNLLFPLWAIAFSTVPFLSVGFVYLIGIVFGILLASVWTTIRPMLIELSPEEEVATRFAFLSISERMAAVIGPLWWGLMVEIVGYKLSTLTLAIFPIFGWFVFRMHIKTE